MPTYVYECSACNSTFEVEQRITENALDTCKCGSKGTVKRLIQPTAVMFKGAGFHINDYAGAGAAAKPAAEPAGETGGGPAAETPKAEPAPNQPAPASEA